MKSKEFNEKLAQKVKIDKKNAQFVVDEFWELVAETIKKGDEVVFPYGKFVLKKRPARTGRNPITGAEVKIPAKIIPQFKPSKRLKEKYVK